MRRNRGTRICKGIKCPRCGQENLYPCAHARGVQRFRCDKLLDGCGWHGTKPVGIEEFQNNGIDREKADALHRKLMGERGVRRYVITAAQNATPVWQPFFAALLNYCKWNDAQLIVIPYRYKNPTSIWTERAQRDDWWAEGLAPYILDRRIELNKNLVLLADIKTQPTASNPLEGFETISGGLSAIIGHPKIEQATIPTPHHRFPKILTTTGAVTKANYLPSKAGKKGEFHHTFGAVVVEMDGSLFFQRHLIAARDGSFCDLDAEYSGTARSPARVKALVMGDWHARYTDPGVRKATFDGPDSMAAVLKPEHVVWHDFHDQDSRNHHDRADPFINLVKQQHGLDVVERELAESFASVDRHHRHGVKFVFPYSNHPNEHLERWVKETDWRGDPANAAFYLRTALAMVEGAHWTANGSKTVDPLIYWAQRKLKCFKDCVFLGPDDSFVVAGVELGMHGHLGLNGARGTLRGFGKVGVRSMVGHGHGPGQKDGVLMVGTSSVLRRGWNKGPSSWLHAHGALYRNGKRTLIIVIDGKWRVPACTQLKEAA